MKIDSEDSEYVNNMATVIKGNNYLNIGPNSNTLDNYNNKLKKKLFDIHNTINQPVNIATIHTSQKIYDGLQKNMKKSIKYSNKHNKKISQELCNT